MIGDNTIGVSFQGFFNDEIKDRIKKVPGAEYDFPNKIWKIPVSQKDIMIDSVCALCIENEVRIFDIPEFV